MTILMCSKGLQGTILIPLPFNSNYFPGDCGASLKISCIPGESPVLLFRETLETTIGGL